jgi:hypothetical protein
VRRIHLPRTRVNRYDRTSLPLYRPQYNVIVAMMGNDVEQTKSTMRAERDRLLEKRNVERERADRLEAELAQARRGFWRRLFGA